MKIFLLVISLFLSSVTFASTKTSIIITEIVDGDTVKAKVSGGKEFPLRLVGVDCYEITQSRLAKSQAYDDNLSINEVIRNGLIAKGYLEKIKNSANHFSFEFKGIDKYGRALGVLYFDDININKKLVAKKYCKSDN